MAEEPVVGIRPEGGGIGPVNFAEGGNPYGVVLTTTRLPSRTRPAPMQRGVEGCTSSQW